MKYLTGAPCTERNSSCKDTSSHHRAFLRPLNCPRILFQPERTHLNIPERTQHSQHPESHVLLVSRRQPAALALGKYCIIPAKCLDMGQQDSEPKGCQPRGSVRPPLCQLGQPEELQYGDNLYPSLFRKQALRQDLQGHQPPGVGPCRASSQSCPFEPCSAFSINTNWFACPGPLPDPGGCQMGHCVFDLVKKKNHQQLLVAVSS